MFMGQQHSRMGGLLCTFTDVDESEYHPAFCIEHFVLSVHSAFCVMCAVVLVVAPAACAVCRTHGSCTAAKRQHCHSVCMAAVCSWRFMPFDSYPAVWIPCIMIFPNRIVSRRCVAVTCLKVAAMQLRLHVSSRCVINAFEISKALWCVSRLLQKQAMFSQQIRPTVAAVTTPQCH
jgi:hypothetical protein